MRLLLVGDTHANPGFFEQACEQAAAEDCRVIFQLGDFGYWPRTEWGSRFLTEADAALKNFDLTCYFIDGNHEHYPSLWDGSTEAAGVWDESQPEAFILKGERIFYVPRATHWTWDGVSFFAMGGAHSVDRKWRKEYIDYFTDEEIRLSDIDRALDQPPARVMFTHDVPTGTLNDTWGGDDWPPQDVRFSKHHQQKLRTVVDHIRPDVLYHGHLHHRYSTTLKLSDGKVVRVEGLAGDRDAERGESWLVLDTEELCPTTPIS